MWSEYEYQIRYLFFTSPPQKEAKSQKDVCHSFMLNFQLLKLDFLYFNVKEFTAVLKSVAKRSHIKINMM